jgi:arylsulfatase A-like enzyme
MKYFNQIMGLVYSTFLVAGGQDVASEKQFVLPNILYILADDLGYGDIGCYGQQEIQTPNIDRLCREGMKFTNHHSGSTVCAPSRACMLTGLHTGHVWVRDNGRLFRLREDPEDITIARVLKDVGYHTAMIGKSGTGSTTDPGHANRKGFDYFYGFNDHGSAHHYFPLEIYRNDEKILFPNNHKHTGDTYIHDEFLKEIMGYLDQRGRDGKPFFLHYAALIPHASLVAPEEWVTKYRGQVGKERPGGGGGGYAKCADPKATFAGMVSRLDWEVGEIMKKLEAMGIASNTLVIFSSDNGPHEEGGNRVEWFNSSGGLRGLKRDLFEGGVRVPLIVNWPGRIKAGSESDHLCASWDLMPTFCELTGAEEPSDIDGISFLPMLLGKNGQMQHDYLYWEFYSRGGRRAALTSRWKAVQYNVSKGSDPVMLFSADDVSERTDVASDHPEVVSKFERIFEQAHTPSPNVSWTK